MNKIYNNLNINNLIKTDLFNQFNKSQQIEILIGLENNLDISIYAKSEFDWLQMREIRWGLEDKLDVSWYAKTETPWGKMKQIRLRLMKESTL